MYKGRKEFVVVFQLSKLVTFEVDYGRVGNNETPYFTTSAMLFASNKKTFRQCGQCQESVLPVFPEAYAFYKKWDSLHFKYMSDEEYLDMMVDLEKLCGIYNYVVATGKDSKIYWNQVVELSKMKPRRSFKTFGAWQKYVDSYNGMEAISKVFCRGI